MEPHDPSYFDVDECKSFFRKGGEKGIVLLHGFTGSVAHMRPLGDALHGRGYTVLGINLPGHAASEADMAAVGSREWLQSALDAVSHLRLYCQTVAACGLSMGALLSLILASRRQVDACVSISAPLPATNLLLPFSGALGLFIPRVTWKEDGEREKLLDQRYDLHYTGFPTQKGLDLYRLTKLTEKCLPQIACPLLAVQSLADRTISPQSADTIFNSVHSRIKNKLILQDVPHVCTISDKLPEIVDAVDALMQLI
jgi:carboxylesterase